MYRKCLEKAASTDFFLQKVTTNAAIEFHLNKDLEQLITSCTEFGSITNLEVVSHHFVDSNKIVSVTGRSRYKVRTSTDYNDCYIRGICFLSDGKFIMADHKNKCVKLLDKTYNCIMQTELVGYPLSMCTISTNEVALTVGYLRSINENYFL
ncbi:hypothetical protein DPMN_146146 [Dreissena polymorpha]|uniref:Uncharacterized protein n=1 Tax=Dreissena polymorpha TaxID=45954 RepID=A0A9D4J1Q3_DREPO|nr:hypothetical protein DPMN_146146 [Dreissena polymorpha]